MAVHADRAGSRTRIDLRGHEQGAIVRRGEFYRLGARLRALVRANYSK